MSQKTGKAIFIVLATIGLLDSIYLTFIKLSKSEIFCSDVGGCDVVNSSPYAEISGIPIALLGAAAYAALILIVALEGRVGLVRDYGRLITFGITLAGTLYSAYLTYIEIAVLRAICPYCVVSAIVMVLLFVLAVWRLKTVTED